MNISKKVAIMMATHNGEKYLSLQIESILAQKYTNWVLFIRDDGSTDGTNNIIDWYTKKYPQKIIQVRDNYLAKSACKNFLLLVKFVKKIDSYDRFDCFMFCDQDDYWLEDKILNSIISIKTDIPMLIHTDLMVVDENLDVINKSFIRMQSLKPYKKRLNNLLIQNDVTGCTMLWNKRLMDLIRNEPLNVYMHDWYIAILAMCYGEIQYIDKPTILYRQHSDNVLGAKRKSAWGIINKVLKGNNVRNYLMDSFSQAEKIYMNYNLPKDINRILKNFINIRSINSKTYRVIYIFANGFLEKGVLKLISEIIYI